MSAALLVKEMCSLWEDPFLDCWEGLLLLLLLPCVLVFMLFELVLREGLLPPLADVSELLREGLPSNELLRAGGLPPALPEEFRFILRLGACSLVPPGIFVLVVSWVLVLGVCSLLVDKGSFLLLAVVLMLLVLLLRLLLLL
jgi:hypothetical protein